MRRPLLLVLPVAAIALAAGWFLLRPAPGATGGTLTLYGNVDIREIQAAFNDGDVITRMPLLEGAPVRKGELIAALDDRRYAARLRQAQQQAAALGATLERLLRGSRPEEIAQARAAMQAARALYDNSELQLARTRRLVPGGAASPEDLDNAQAQLRAARGNYEAARQAYLLAVKGPRAEDIAAARAAHQAAAAAAALAEREYADTRLYSPVDGIIENRILEPGDMAAPGTPVYTIALTSPLWVRAYVSEADLGKVRPGLRASVTTDSFPGREYAGWVGYLSPTSEFTPKTVESPDLRARLVYQLRVYVCNPRGELRLGMPATVRIDLAHPPGPQADGAADCGAGRDQPR